MMHKGFAMLFLILRSAVQQQALWGYQQGNHKTQAKHSQGISTADRQNIY
jgi:hypothetical protein